MAYKVNFEVRIFDWNGKVLNFGLPNPVQTLDETKVKMLQIMDSFVEMFGEISYSGLEDIKPECWGCDGRFECNRKNFQMLVCQAEGSIIDDDQTEIIGKYSIKIYENLR